MKLDVSRLRRATALLLILAMPACASGNAGIAGGKAIHIAAIGDSIAAGQGAPDRPAGRWPWNWMPKWQDDRCNRSVHAGTFQAVDRLRSAHPGVAIDSRSFACSGATVAKGLLGPYDGVVPIWKQWLRPDKYREPLRPQIEDLLDWAKRLDGERDPAAPRKPPIDVLTISIGGNDILVGPIVAACVTTPDCRLAHGVIERELRCLPAYYDELREALDKELGAYVNHIVVTGYPEPVRDESARPCNHAPLVSENMPEPLAGFSTSEAEWASGIIRKLNRAIENKARAEGWTFVDVNSDSAGDEGFVGHGWCSEDSWINTINQSVKKQRHYRGGVHPNAAGHDVYARRLFEALDEMLFPRTPEKDIEANRPASRAATSREHGRYESAASSSRAAVGSCVSSPSVKQP